MKDLEHFVKNNFAKDCDFFAPVDLRESDKCTVVMFFQLLADYD